jgi:radical SAM protein (TIGR01212 family)
MTEALQATPKTPPESALSQIGLKPPAPNPLYRPISEFYRERFGEKVYKIPVAVVDDCPNRAGLKGMKTCIFCDPWGSAARADSFQMSLDDQILTTRERFQKKYRAESFLVYFQAYTNSFAKISQLEFYVSTALKHSFVKGIVVGTRPDCISQSVLDLWTEVARTHFVSIELGVQSFCNNKLRFLERGHSAEQSVKAISRISDRGLDVGIHLIFGIPGETDQEIIDTAQRCNSLPINNVKLHNLHVLKKTGLELLYKAGKFFPIDFESYAKRVALFLDYLKPQIFVHRLAALSSRSEELIAPDWVRFKMKTHQDILHFLEEGQHFQGKHFCS